VTRGEGKSGKRSFVFTVNLSIAYDQPVTVNYSTADGTATARAATIEPNPAG
jgi:hypothetical protein